MKTVGLLFYRWASALLQLKSFSWEDDGFRGGIVFIFFFLTLSIISLVYFPSLSQSENSNKALMITFVIFFLYYFSWSSEWSFNRIFFAKIENPEEKRCSLTMVLTIYVAVFAISSIKFIQMFTPLMTIVL